MNAAWPLLYTSEIPPKFPRALGKSTFTEQHLAAFNEQAFLHLVEG
jgi:hypothetical protein